jgi:hypothetical protein
MFWKTTLVFREEIDCLIEVALRHDYLVFDFDLPLEQKSETIKSIENVLKYSAHRSLPSLMNDPEVGNCLR